MDHTKLQKAILFIFMFANMELAICKACFLTPKMEVRIVNYVTVAPLQLRCQSKDDDLGVHVLTTNQVYNWRFCDTIEENTLFFCHLRAGPKDKSFDVYTSIGRDIRCPNHVCTWLAYDDGIYLNGKLIYPW